MGNNIAVRNSLGINVNDVGKVYIFGEINFFGDLF